MTGVTVAPASVSVKIGATVALTKTITPSNADDQSGTWTSSDTKIATVDANGIVRGVAAGVVNITFTTKGGSKVATSRVTVTA